MFVMFVSIWFITLNYIILSQNKNTLILRVRKMILDIIAQMGWSLCYNQGDCKWDMFNSGQTYPVEPSTVCRIHMI